MESTLMKKEIDLNGSCSATQKHCLVCNKLLTTFHCTTVTEPVADGNSVETIMSAILRQPLLSLVADSATVCVMCINLLKEIYTLDVRTHALKGSVRRSFTQTHQKAEQFGECTGSQPSQVFASCLVCDKYTQTEFATTTIEFQKVPLVEDSNIISELQIQLMPKTARKCRKSARPNPDPAFVGCTEDPSALPSSETGQGRVLRDRRLPTRTSGRRATTTRTTTTTANTTEVPESTASAGSDGSGDDDAGADNRDVSEDDLQCDSCDAVCADAAELALHRQRCGQAATATDVQWCCPLCERQFRYLPQLKRHTRRHKLPTKRLAVCYKCGAVLDGAAALAAHAAQHPADAADIVVCGVCGLGFRSDAQLAAHAELHVVTCSVCHKQLRKDSLREHMRRHTGETPYACTECDKRFVAFSSLRAHRRTHTGDKPHKCHLCPEMFHLKESLADHLEWHEGRTLHCAECGRQFDTSRRLAAHAKTHDRRRWQPHTCEFCGDGFMTRRSLRHHRARHTGSLPFTCHICQKGFTYEDTYKEHLSVHSGQRPFTCEVCGKSFGRRSCLWAHRNQHTAPRRFVCKYCQKEFSLQSAFTVHMRIHTGERPYSCSTCSGSFRLLGALKRHSCSAQLLPPIGQVPTLQLPPNDASAAAPDAPLADPIATALAAPVAAPTAPIAVQISTVGGPATAHIHLPCVEPPPPELSWRSDHAYSNETRAEYVDDSAVVLHVTGAS